MLVFTGPYDTRTTKKGLKQASRVEKRVTFKYGNNWYRFGRVDAYIHFSNI